MEGSCLAYFLAHQLICNFVCRRVVSENDAGFMAYAISKIVFHKEIPLVWMVGTPLFMVAQLWVFHIFDLVLHNMQDRHFTQLDAGNYLSRSACYA